MNAMQMLLSTDWLWPAVLGAMTLVAAFTASLVWASGSSWPRPRAAQPLPQARAATRRAHWLITLAVPLSVMALYAALGNPRALNPLARNPVPGEAAETMVSQLAERLQTQPDNLNGWLMLARSYKVLQRYEESAAAWERAKELVWTDVDSLAEWVETRILAQSQRFDARSQEVLARAMSIDPEHPGVLMLRGLAALDRADVPAAQLAFARLRDITPEGSPDRAALDSALAQLAQGRDPRAGAAAAQPAPAVSTPSASAPAPR